MAHESLQVVRAIHAAWAEGASPRELIAEDLEYVNPDYAVESGTRRDRKALTGVLDVYPDFHFEPERYIEAGDDVVVLGKARGTGASGVEVNWKQGWIWTVEGGKAIRLRWFNDPDEALAAAGLSG